MATVVMTSPRNGGTYQTAAGGALVAFPARGYCDTANFPVSLYEDSTSALLGSAASGSSPETQGTYAGWYPWTVWVYSWTSSAGLGLPGGSGAGSVGGIGLRGALGIPGVSAAGAAGYFLIGSANNLALPAGQLSSAAASFGVTAVAGLPGASAAGTAGSIGAVIPGAPSLYNYAPDALLAQTGMSGSLFSVQDSPDSPDANSVTGTSVSTSWNARFSFPAPPGSLVTGAAGQQFRAAVRKSSANTPNPLARLELWQNGVLVRAGVDVAITALPSDPAQIITLDWNASELTSDPSGIQVECRMVGTTQNVSSVYNTPVLHALEWVAQSTGTRDLYSEFAGAVNDAPGAEWGSLEEMVGSGTYTTLLNGAGQLIISRTAGSGTAAARIKTTATYAPTAGRYIRTAMFPEGAAGGCTLALVGTNYYYEFAALNAGIGEDGEGYPIYGVGVTVRKYNATTHAEIGSGTILSATAPPAWVSPRDMELRFGASTVDVYGQGTLLGAVSLADLGSFSVGLTLRSTTTITSLKTADWIEVGANS